MPSTYYTGYCPETEQDETICILKSEVPILGTLSYEIKWYYECPHVQNHQCSIQTDDYMSCPLFMEGQHFL